MIRLIWHSAILIAYAVVFAETSAAADTFPDHPVRIIVGAAPGGTIDFLGRFIAQPLAQKWGTSVVVDNRPGASNALSASLVAHAPADGYTLLMVNNNHTTPSETKLDYDPLKSFAPILMIATNGSILVAHPSLPISSLKDLIALAKSRPGQLNFGSPGAGSTNYLGMKILMDRTGTDMVHIAYKGGAPVMNALLGGEIQLTFASVPVSLGFIKTGKLKALAVNTSSRNPLIPDIPTVAEAANLPGFNVLTWTGIVAPAGTSTAVVRKVRDDIVDALKPPDMQRTLTAQAFTVPAENTSEQFGAYMADEIAAWARIKSDGARK